MPRRVPLAAAKRRRERLSALLDALGQCRGSKVTQREFAASVGREQGTIAAILGGHRALGGDVMLAVVQAYGLPADYFDGPLKPDPRPFARATVGGVPSVTTRAVGPARVGVGASPPPRDSVYGGRDPELAAVLAALHPDRAVAMALEALSQTGVVLDGFGWAKATIEGQSAHDRGVLGQWFAGAAGSSNAKRATAE